MAQNAQCPACRHVFSVPERLAGTEVFCPGCRKPFTVPEEDEQEEEEDTEGVYAADAAPAVADQKSTKGPFAEFRRSVYKHLDQTLKAFDAVPDENPAKCRMFLKRLHKQLRLFAPKPEVKTDYISKSNALVAHQLGWLSDTLQDVIAKDVGLRELAVDENEAHQMISERLQVLQSIVERLEWRANVEYGLALDVRGLSSDDRTSLHMLVSEAFRRKGVSKVVDTQNCPDESCPSRKLILQVEEMYDRADGTGGGSSRVLGIAEYRKDDRQHKPKFRKKKLFGSVNWRAGDDAGEVVDKLADAIVLELPRAVMENWDVKWGGILISCPRCGHPHFVTRRLAKVRYCLSCGDDPVTGLPHEVLQQKELSSNLRGWAVAAGVGGVIALIITFLPGFFGYEFVGIVTALLYFLGIAGVIGVPLLLWLSKQTGESASQAESEECKSFKYPELSNENKTKVRNAEKAAPECEKFHADPEEYVD